ncbi:TPA: TniB family NTP-binding protein, partial [Salmonella enterica subsp. enterica serovar Strathcona]
MSRFEDVQEQLNVLSPIPVNMPKLYLLGDTGAGKTTIVRKMLGTHKLKFPSVQQKRTTVAITEYVLS